MHEVGFHIENIRWSTVSIDSTGSYFVCFEFRLKNNETNLLVDNIYWFDWFLFTNEICKI